MGGDAPAIREIIDRYNEDMDAAAAAEHHGLLAAGLEREELVFGGRPLCNVLRPQLLTEREYAEIGAASRHVLAALRRAHRAFETDEAVRATLALTHLEGRAWDLDPGYAPPSPLSRLDAFFNHADSSLLFVEYNAETPAGVGYEDVLGGVFQELPAVRALAARHPLRLVQGRRVLLDALVDLAAAAGVPGPHAIAIVDWSDVPTQAEFRILARYFEAAGVPTVVVAPDELGYAGGRLTAAGRPVTIVYKRILVAEFLAAFGLDNPLTRALRDRAAVMVNPFRCAALHKKAIFAVLTDERFGHLFTAEQRREVMRHVPWTRRVEARTTELEGATIDLLDHVARHKEGFVLKPNDAYGGAGVVLGWEADDATWSKALEEGLTTPMVVQTRVPVAPEPFPVWTGSDVRIEPRLVDLDPYCYHGTAMHGTLTRLSAGSLLNVTAGAGSVAPTFIIDAT